MLELHPRDHELGRVRILQSTEAEGGRSVVISAVVTLLYPSVSQHAKQLHNREIHRSYGTQYIDRGSRHRWPSKQLQSMPDFYEIRLTDKHRRQQLRLDNKGTM